MRVVEFDRVGPSWRKEPVVIVELTPEDVAFYAVQLHPDGTSREYWQVYEEGERMHDWPKIGEDA